MTLPEGIGWWVGTAVTVFWFVGAYNRLVRLRSLATQAYVALDGALVRQVEYVQSRIAEKLDGKLESKADGKTDGREEGQAAPDSGLLAAVVQLTALLAATRARPLDARAIAPLATALRVLLSTWERLHPDEVTSFDIDGTLSRPAPLTPDDASAASAAVSSSEPPMAWPEPSAVAELARGQFNQAVARYNAAIGQFPAFIVAWAFRLRPAAPFV